MATKVGGQAVVDGVMMRSGERFAVAVRRPDGVIDVTTGDLPTWGRPARTVPVLRGVVALAEALPVGFRAMRWATADRRSSSLGILAVVAAAVVVPSIVIERLGSLGAAVVVAQLLQLVLGAVVLVGSVAAIGRLDELRRLFQYHGAEHQVVAAHEAGVDLTPAGAAGFSTRHVRCGTSLLLWLLLLSAVGSVIPGVGASPLLLLLVLGMAAELQLRAAGATGHRWVQHLLRPGLALQRVTTRTPTFDQLEVAIAALRAAMAPVPASAPLPADPVPASTNPSPDPDLTPSGTKFGVFSQVDGADLVPERLFRW